MERDFKLETILAITTGDESNIDLDELIDFGQYVMDDREMSLNDIFESWPLIRDHILDLYPTLIDIEFVRTNTTSYTGWILEQAQRFGDTIRISQYGEPLKKENNQVLS